MKVMLHTLLEEGKMTQKEYDELMKELGGKSYIDQ
jgi:hypothetical protein